MLVKPGGYHPPVLDCESEPIVTFDPNRSDIGRFAPGATAAPVASAPSVTVRPNSVSVDHPHGSKWVKQNGKWTHLVRGGGSEQVCTCSAAPLSRQQVVSAGKREASRFAAAVELNARTVSDVPDGTRWPALTGAATDGCLPVSAGGDAWYRLEGQHRARRCAGRSDVWVHQRSGGTDFACFAAEHHLGRRPRQRGRTGVTFDGGTHLTTMTVTRRC